VKKILFLSFLSVVGVAIYAQQSMKTETLNWCKCDPYTVSNPETRKASECEIIFYDTVVKELMLALAKVMQNVSDFSVTETLSNGSEKIEYVASDVSDHPFNIGDLGTVPPPTIIWNSADSKFIDESYQKIDSLAKILENSMQNGTWNNALCDRITYQTMEIQEKTRVRLVIYTNRNFEQKVYGSKIPYLLKGTPADQAIHIPFSQNSEADKSSGYKGITDNQIILLYGAYKPVKIFKTPDDPATYTVMIETDIASSKPKLNLYSVEFRFLGSQKVIDEIIKLIDHKKINDLIMKY
jgi:hypothetical protein